MKKVLFVVALVALMVPATFGRSYLHSDGTWTTSSGNASNPDQERTGDNLNTGNWETKAESYNWPAEYKFVAVATIKVKMDVGYWIKFNTDQDTTLVLKQIEIHKYAGQIDITVESNVNIQIKASFSNSTGVNIEKDFLKLNGSADQVNLDAPGGVVTLQLQVKNVDVKALGLKGVAGQCTQIGTITLSVRPNVTPTLAGAC